MANTRFNYDTCRTIKRLQESTDPSRYILDTPGPGCHPAFILDPAIIPQKWGANLYTNSTILENHLLGIDKVITKCENCKGTFNLRKRKFYACKLFLTTRK